MASAGIAGLVVGAAVLGAQLGAIALDPAVALACRDKALQKAKWQQAGVPTARFAVLPEAAVQSERETTEELSRHLVGR